MSVQPSEILITGAFGYIGSHLRVLLPEALSLDLHPEADFSTAIARLDKHTSDLQKIKVVIHLADKRLQDIHQQNLQSNIDEHAQFLLALQKLPQLQCLLFSSSCSVYGQSDQLIDEGSKVHPTSPYAQSKLAVEALIQEYKLPARILRFGTAYGLSPIMRFDLLINDLAQSFSDQQEREIYGPDAWRPYVHCRDFARAIVRALDLGPGALINIVESNLTKRQLIKMLESLTKKPLPLKINDERPDLRNYQIDINTCRELGFSFDYPLGRGLKELLHGAT